MDHQQKEKSANSDSEEIEIKICTKKNCQHCQRRKVVNEGHYFKMIDTLELCVEC